jgi:hypothetical protein
MDAILVEGIMLPLGYNPMPYTPEYTAWNDHVAHCDQCAHVDTLAAKGEEVQITDLCVPGAACQVEVQYSIKNQYVISLSN